MQANTGNVQLPAFRLYGLLGCPHCAMAQEFFNREQIPVLVVVGNDDPIADAGVRWALAQKNPTRGADAPAAYPMLVCTFGKQIVEGYREDEYRKLADAYHVLFGTGAPNQVGGGQQLDAEAAPQAAETTAGA